MTLNAMLPDGTVIPYPPHEESMVLRIRHEQMLAKRMYDDQARAIHRRVIEGAGYAWPFDDEKAAPDAHEQYLRARIVGAGNEREAQEWHGQLLAHRQGKAGAERRPLTNRDCGDEHMPGKGGG